MSTPYAVAAICASTSATSERVLNEPCVLAHSVSCPVVSHSASTGLAIALVDPRDAICLLDDHAGLGEPPGDVAALDARGLAHVHRLRGRLLGLRHGDRGVRERLAGVGFGAGVIDIPPASPPSSSTARSSSTTARSTPPAPAAC